MLKEKKHLLRREGLMLKEQEVSANSNYSHAEGQITIAFRTNNHMLKEEILIAEGTK
jgi:hypothetical protein